MDALHVKLFKCPLPKSKPISGFSMQIMSQRVGNASVVLHFTAHEKFRLYEVKLIIPLYKKIKVSNQL
jgi:hypothetical protein